MAIISVFCPLDFEFRKGSDSFLIEIIKLLKEVTFDFGVEG